MLGLALREEFRDKRLKGTTIELSNDSNTGATQIAAQEFLGITHSTHDFLRGIEAIGPDHGDPVFVIGESLHRQRFRFLGDLLKVREWGELSPGYKKLHKGFEGELRDILKRCSDLFAVLRLWNFADPNLAYGVPLPLLMEVLTPRLDMSKFGDKA